MTLQLQKEGIWTNTDFFTDSNNEYDDDFFFKFMLRMDLTEKYSNLAHGITFYTLWNTFMSLQYTLFYTIYAY
jgi:hypothetical protein